MWGTISPRTDRNVSESSSNTAVRTSDLANVPHLPNNNVLSTDVSFPRVKDFHRDVDWSRINVKIFFWKRECTVREVSYFGFEKWNSLSITTTNTHTHIYVYIYICMYIYIKSGLAWNTVVERYIFGLKCNFRQFWRVWTLSGTDTNNQTGV
jgi:hypothetical protein